MAPSTLANRPSIKSVVFSSVGIGAAAFAAYAALAARDPMFGDGTELVAAAITNGIAHPPGYPLWVLLGHLATFVPIGTLAYRVNLTACAYHAVAIALVFLSGWVLTRSRTAALVAALLLAAGSPLFASWSLQAEVFSLNDLFAAAIVLVCLIWLREPQRWNLTVALAALFGLGSSNQQTIVLLAPAALWAAWCARRSAPPFAAQLRIGATACVVFTAGFALPYAHTLVASQHLKRWQLGTAKTPPDLLPLILRRDFGTFTLVPVSAEQGGSPLARIAQVVAYGGVPWIAISLGLFFVRRKARVQVGFASLIVLTTLLFFPVVADIDTSSEIARGVFLRFGLLPVVALAPFAAYAFQTRAVKIVALLVTAAIAAPVLASVSLAQTHDARTFATDIFAALPPHAILLTAGAPTEQSVTYFHTVERLRPDVTPVTYVCLFFPQCRDELARSINVPPAYALGQTPNEMRDALMRANPKRPFYVAGERPIHVAGPFSAPLVDGIVSQRIPLDAKPDVRERYLRETALQWSAGYGDVSASFWRSNGYAEDVRAAYAAGFYFGGLDAKRLGRAWESRRWFERAALYASDPLIERELSRPSR